MSASAGSSGLAETVMTLLPSDVAGADEFDRLSSFTRDLDALVAASGRTKAVDQGHLFKLIDGRDIFPSDLRERVKGELTTHLGSHLEKGAHGHAPIPWHALHEHGASFAPAGVARLRELGFSNDTSADEARALLAEHFPYLPHELVAADAERLHEFAVHALEHNRTVWDCCVAHLGWWGALAVFAIAGAFLIVGTATGPWGIPLAIWLIGVLGGGTAVIVMNCVINPNR
jgi:hypothetical protein